MVSLTSALLSLGLLTAICIGILIFLFILTKQIKELRSKLRKAELNCKFQIQTIDYQRDENERLRGILDAAGVEHETS